MPDHPPRPTDASDAPLDPTVARAVRALQGGVPVRPEWRAELLDATLHPAPRASGRKLVLAWPVAAAAAAMLFAAGAALSLVVGHGRNAPAATVAMPAVASPPAGTRFVFVAPNAKRVALVGDFNLWDPSRAPMHRIAGTDAWEVDLRLPAGRHTYAFVVDGDVTADPSAPRTAGDDFGRPSSVVLVSSNQS